MDWFYAIEDRQIGPVTEVEFTNLVASGTIQAGTLVWRRDQQQWRPYGSIQQGEEEPGSRVPAAQNVEGVGFCSECGRQELRSEMAQFGTSFVCVDCKELFTHRLRETGVGRRTVRYVGFWARALAKLIDSIILSIAEVAIMLPFGMSFRGPTAFDPAMGAYLLGGFLVQASVGVAYDSLFVYKLQATPGKMALGQKVVMADGRPLTLKLAVARHFAAWLSSAILLIGFVMAAFDEEKRALHDRICDTRVVAK